MMTLRELELLNGLLEALFRKCKSDGLREPTLEGIRIVKREIELEIAVKEIQEEAFNEIMKIGRNND